jgi:DNA-binding GntR family transcriptional regulator
VYATLRDATIEGLVEPQERLSEEHLAQRFGVSRTPVREALLRLEAEHLATRISRRGLVVRRITVDEIFEVYAVREMLDGLAARLAAESASPPEIARLRWMNQQLKTAASEADYVHTTGLNIEFHEALVSCAHNGLLRQLARNGHDRVRRFPRTESYPGQTELTVMEHQRVIEAIERRDGHGAERCAREHIARARDSRVLETRSDSPVRIPLS